ncbi:type III pantothenate kinase [Oligella ureolytica]
MWAIRVKFAYYEALSCSVTVVLSDAQRFILTHDEIEQLSDRLTQFNKKPTLVIGVNVAGSLMAARSL